MSCHIVFVVGVGASLSACSRVCRLLYPVVLPFLPSQKLLSDVFIISVRGYVDPVAMHHDCGIP